MGTWIKETDKAIYLMEGNFFIDKIEKRPRENGEYELSIAPMQGWFSRTDAPSGMVVAVGIQAAEPEPKPVPTILIEVTKIPAAIAVGEMFLIEGTTDKSSVGQSVKLYVDDQLATAAPKVNADGTWEINYRFFGIGSRKLEVKIGEASKTFVIDVISGSKVELSGSVGAGGANRAEDVLALKARLVELGFNFFKPGPRVESDLIYAIRLFQSVIAGSTQLIGDGRVDVNGRTHVFLRASNAPRWGLMPLSGDGFINYELKAEIHDHHDYGVNWLGDTIIAAAKAYEASYRQGRSSISLIALNDVSLPEGGDTPDHAGHECGNACDIFLPKKGGDFGGVVWWSWNYDRDATRAMLKALKKQPLTKRIFFNDPTLIQEGLCDRAGGHDNHIHFEVGAPQPQ